MSDTIYSDSGATVWHRDRDPEVEVEHLRSLLEEVAGWIDLMEHPGPLAQATRKKIAEALSA